ncbi:MAG: S9 family peptidase [Chloroflexota bacterium]|nr:S9 family peptidase [Chloroflexota bacterium]
MTQKRIAPYGSWKSPITATAIASESFGLAQVAIDGDDLYWTETRPWEGGRSVIVRQSTDGQTSDVTPAEFNVRNRVHEYGGGAFTVHGGVVYFTNDSDQRVYAHKPGETPTPLTPDDARRYADLEVDQRHNRILCVCEDHSQPDAEPTNTIVAIGIDGGEIETIAEGNDFYSSPRVSPNGDRVCWLAWDHPNMPWDATQLWVADVDKDGRPANAQLVAGYDGESIGEPLWSPDGTLYFVSDRTGWWNLYRWDGSDSATNICPMEAEFTGPQWQFGGARYGFASADEIICSYTQDGFWRIARIDPRSGKLESFDLPFTDLSRGALKVGNGWAAFISGSPTQPKSVVKLDLKLGAHTVVVESSSLDVDASYFSVPEGIEFPTEGGETAHAFYYPPTNPDFEAPSGELPPMIVISHGGPTGATSATLDLETEFWTSRGFAVLDVNYGGSTGYGTEYRRRLNGSWGIVDLDDCVNGARYAASSGRADGDRLIVRGSSAGGYTTLACLAFRDVFKAGASHYGIGDLETLARDTHKFESRYLDSLIGPYPAERDVYVERSPIHYVDDITCPVILFQGLEDEIVPPSQAETMVEAVKRKGIPVSYVPFEGEQHGFRKAESIEAALHSELYFYSQVFGFELAQQVDPVPIHNLTS